MTVARKYSADNHTVTQVFELIQRFNTSVIKLKILHPFLSL